MTTWRGKGTYLCKNKQWKALKQELKRWKTGYRQPWKAAEKLHDQLWPTQEDTEALNETVTQAVERVFESHLKGLTKEAQNS